MSKETPNVITGNSSGFLSHLDASAHTKAKRKHSSKNRYNEMDSQGAHVKIKSEHCVVCNSSYDGASWDIYSTYTEGSRCLLAEYLTKTSESIFDRDKISSLRICKSCYDLVIQLDVAEMDYLNLKNEFLIVLNSNFKACALAPFKKYVECQTQTEDGYGSKIEFCSVEIKDECDDDDNIPFLDSPAPVDYDSDDIPLAKKEKVEKAEKAEKPAKEKHKHEKHSKKAPKLEKKEPDQIKSEILDISYDPSDNFSCRECLEKFNTKAQAAVHAFMVHRINLATDPGIILKANGKPCRTRRVKKRKTYSELGASDIDEDPDDKEWSVAGTSGTVIKERPGPGRKPKGPLLATPIPVKPFDGILPSPSPSADQLQKKLGGGSLTIKKVGSSKKSKRPRPDNVLVVGQASASSVLSQLQLVGLQVMSNVLERPVKKPKQLLPCLQCKATFATQARLDYHMVKHLASKSPFICEICGASYKHKKACDIHVGMHKGISPWKCAQCGKIFPSKGALSRHEAIHTGKPNYQCDLCGKSFIHTSSFKMHKLSHTGVKPHSCNKCGLALMTRSHLKRHQRVHSGEKRHECLICGKKFSERYNLYAHQKSHETLNGIIQRQMKNHDCSVCDATFNRRYILEKHMETVHQRVMEVGVKRPRNTMTKLLKKQAMKAEEGQEGNPAEMSISNEIDIKPPSPVAAHTPPHVHTTDSTSSTLMGESSNYQSTSVTVLDASPNTSRSEPPQQSSSSQQQEAPGSSGPPASSSIPPGAAGLPWATLAHYHLANDYPLRMHGVDYAGYLNRQ